MSCGLDESLEAVSGDGFSLLQYASEREESSHMDSLLRQQESMVRKPLVIG